MSETSARLALPLLAAGQAQKEITHNEALTLIDLALHPAVEMVGVNAPPTEPAAGQAWVVGAAPVGAWSGHAGAIAGWSEGGWRFVTAMAGMTVWSIADHAPARCVGDGWSVMMPQPAIPQPTGGTTVDAPARAAIAAILAALRAHSVVKP